MGMNTIEFKHCGGFQIRVCIQYSLYRSITVLLWNLVLPTFGRVLLVHIYLWWLTAYWRVLQEILLQLGYKWGESVSFVFHLEICYWCYWLGSSGLKTLINVDTWLCLHPCRCPSTTIDVTRCSGCQPALWLLHPVVQRLATRLTTSLSLLSYLASTHTSVRMLVVVRYYTGRALLHSTIHSQSSDIIFVK